MKILFLGNIGIGQTSRMRMRAIERLGHTVRGVETATPWRNASWLQRQLQRKLQRGRVIDTINSEVLEAACDFHPDWVWAEKQEFLAVETLKQLRKHGSRLIHFTPDPYFTLDWKRTHLMDEAIRQFDVLLYCKKYERGAYESLGCRVIYMPLGYCDETHRPMQALDVRWRAQVGFLGGWEPRREYLLAKVARQEHELKIWGGYWEFLQDGQWSLRRRIILRQLAGGEAFRIHRDDTLGPCLQGGEVYGDDYARALSGSLIGLGFLRTVCPDQHTTRTFEIPACGSMLLADRTDEHCEFFEEGREAEFFASEAELLEKLRYYIGNEAARSKIAAAGRQRCEAAGYSYLARLETVFRQLQNPRPVSLAAKNS